MKDSVKVVYKDPKGETWEKTVSPEVAAKMVKLGRWKYEKPAPPKEVKK